MTSVNYDIEKELRRWLSEAQRVVVAGIGNPIRSDDFVGVKIVQDLKGRVTGDVMLMECETVPEAYLQQIADFRPTHVILIDAAILGLRPGESRLVEPEKLVDFPAFSTHMLSLSIFCDCVRETVKAKISLLLIEPEKTDFGEEMSNIVKDAVRSLVTAIIHALPKII